MWKKIIVFVIVLIGGAAIFGYIYIPKFAAKKLNESLAKADSASFSNLRFDYWDGHVELDDLYINDTSGRMLDMPLLVQVKTLQILHINTWKLLTTKRIFIDTVFLGSGKLAFTLPEKDSTQTKSSTTKKQKLKSFFIAHTILDSLALDVRFHKSDTGTRVAGVINFEATNLGAPLNDFSKFEAEDLHINMNDLYAQNNDGISVYRIDQIALNKSKKTIAVQGIKIRQRLHKSDYARHFGFDKLHYEIDVDSVVLRDLPTLNEMMKRLHIPKVDIYKPYADLYKDRRFYHKPHKRKFPFEAIDNLEFPMRVDTIALHHGTLYFQENSRNDGRTAKLDLQDIEAKISNVTSDGENELGHWTNVEADVKFYDQLPFSFSWKFDLRKQGKTFLFDGTFGQGPLALFNPFLINKTNVIFQKGDFLGGRIIAEGNKKNGEGTLDFYYKDLRVKWLNKDDHGSGLGHKIAGSAANLFIKNKNLRDKNPKRGIIYAEPEQDRFIISFLWRLMQAGLIDILLTSNNSQKAEQRSNQYLK